MTFVMLLYCGLLQFWKYWTPPSLSPWFPQHQALLVLFQTCRAWDLGYTLLCYLYLIYSTCSRNIRLFSQASMSFQMSVPLCLLIHLPELSSLIFLPGNLLHWCPNSLFMSLLWVNFLHAAFLPIGYPLPYVSWYIVCA